MSRIARIDAIGLVSLVVFATGIAVWWVAASAGFSFTYSTFDGAYAPAESVSFSQPAFVPLGSPVFGSALHIATGPMVLGLVLAALGAVGAAFAIGNRLGRLSRH
ncbi:hypothetical protein SCB71_08045 [Herbiconiux sp. KACC 21604]|uniref:hypothetical protein n=1 Tax=unclassified Herbiconiux TaxID=2618217 RepID=UPI001490A463|nr:hypothetical protein [Herbiconiux sp. SALV-R1]QJU53224.1 hypothetical protein HL652_06010 [Herbiconiux sp. SALV-R1]WPO88179.1 hypothetical protein SCB71_08045 [Herbiconiux sp. KACC 21604]